MTRKALTSVDVQCSFTFEPIVVGKFIGRGNHRLQITSPYEQDKAYSQVDADADTERMHSLMIQMKWKNHIPPSLPGGGYLVKMTLKSEWTPISLTKAIQLRDTRVVYWG